MAHCMHPPSYPSPARGEGSASWMRLASPLRGEGGASAGGLLFTSPLRGEVGALIADHVPGGGEGDRRPIPEGDMTIGEI